MTAEHNLSDVSSSVDKPSEWRITGVKSEKQCHGNN